jgi:hypothetical protein
VPLYKQAAVTPPLEPKPPPFNDDNNEKGLNSSMPMMMDLGFRKEDPGESTTG